MGRQGFEPRTEWLRATCSAAELTPRKLGWTMGLEPTTTGITTRGSTN